LNVAILYQHLQASQAVAAVLTGFYGNIAECEAVGII
jgi:hypothetical protein